MNEAPFSLFIFDLDGTALGGHEPYEQFPPEFSRLLDKLDAHGVKWATATTWDVDKQLKLIRSSGVKSNPFLLTGSTGRTAVSVINNKVFPIIKHIKETAKLDCEFKKRYENLSLEIIDKLKNRNCIEDVSYNRFGHHVISFTATKGKENELWQILQPLFKEGVYYPFKPGELEKNSLLPEYMNKGRAVKIIQELANVPPDRTLIAGDETNDLHMFEPKLAKYMVCPNNAHVEIKRAVMENNGIIAKKNYSYGIVEAVNKLLLPEKKRTEK
jgi:hydroxymethylpyrimidine pyrophosphatase-like HAD family hydrolase